MGVGSIGVGKPKPGQDGGFVSLHGQGIGLAGFMVPTLRVQSAMHVRIFAGGNPRPYRNRFKACSDLP